MNEYNIVYNDKIQQTCKTLDVFLIEATLFIGIVNVLQTTPNMCAQSSTCIPEIDIPFPFINVLS